MVNLHRMVASLLRCYRGEAKRLEIPQCICDAEGPDFNQPGERPA